MYHQSYLNQAIPERGHASGERPKPIKEQKLINYPFNIGDRPMTEVRMTKTDNHQMQILSGNLNTKESNENDEKTDLKKQISNELEINQIHLKELRV